MSERLSAPVSDAVARARRAGGGPGRAAKGERPGAVGGEWRRRDLLPLLVLHLIAREPAYGNRLIDDIEAVSEGVLSANPNTVYPLLRDLEERGLIEGAWEHPDRRTRRFYSITPAGRKEQKRLRSELEPFLDALIRSAGLIKREIYGDG